MVDIDSEEVGKLVEKGCDIQLPIITELNVFLRVFLKKIQDSRSSFSCPSWFSLTQEWKKTYDSAEVDTAVKYKLDAGVPNGVMNVYSFLEKLNERLPDDSTIVPDQGGNLCWSMQTLKVRKEQRLYTNLGSSSMGFAFPCCICSALGAEEPKRPIICIDGDGGFIMNTQELKTCCGL